MLYPNNLQAVGFIRGATFTGSPALFLNVNKNMRGQYTVFPKTAAYPSGYSTGGALAMPYVAGGLSSWQAVIQLTGQGNALSGGPMIGTGALSLSSDGGLSLVISLSGNGDIAVSVDGNVALTIGMAGNGDFTVTGAGGLSMIVPVAGSGSIALTGDGNLKGNLDMEGSWTPFTELSPENLATAVWSALAADNNVAGTMGDLLNAAGGGGISGAVIDQIADAVWEKVGSNGAEYGATLTSAEKWAKIAAALSA